jgi:uncharacterized membrane protein
MKATLWKTATYRVVSMSVTILLAFSMTGSFKAASALGLMNLTVNSAVYFGFEKIWASVVKA